MPRYLLPFLLTLALAACDVSTVVTPVSSDAAQPNPVSITETSITDDQAIISWSSSGPEPAEHWRLYQNNLLVCSADLGIDLLSSDASGNYQQSSACTLTLEEGDNSVYVQLCNISENSTSTCSTSAIQQIFYEAADPTPGAISWQDLPSSTSDTSISATWLKADGSNGDYWFVYHDGAQACTGALSYTEDYVAQSADCVVNLDEGVNQLQAELCSDQPAGIQDLCTQSEVASVTLVLDPAKELATPVLNALDEGNHYAGIDTNVSWYKDTSVGSAGDAWSLHHNGTVVCQAQLAAEADSASCTIQLVEGDNALQVELCTDVATYSGARCAQSNTLAVAALDPEPVTPGIIHIANVSSILAETSDSVAPLEWVIDIGSGVQHWSVDLNGVEYCVTSSTSEYYQEGSCLLNLVVGINSISVRGCNYGYDDVAACSTSEAITTERVALPGTPELTSSLPATTYDAEHNLSWERTTGASAERWLAFVDGDVASDQCHTELSPQTPQSDSCMVELGSGINEVLVRLCVDSSTASYCVDSDSLYTELLAPIPATPEISTESQSIADDSIELEWSKSSGANGSYWSVTNNGAEVAACADRPVISAGAEQSGSCTLPLELGENIVSVRLCADNIAGTASCADSNTISITRLVAAPEFTSAASVAAEEISTAVFYTAVAEDNDSSAEQISFALSGGDDVDFFQLDSTSGALAFHTPVDYEIPQDSDADNVYQLNITAADELGNSAQLELAVSLSNINDNPPILTAPPASLTVAENDSSVVYTFTASDLDGDALSYSIDGADAQYFALGAASGTLQFQPAADYETPLDANQDNVYELNISVSDGDYHSSSAQLSIAVADSYDEAPQATSASSVALAIDSLVVGATIYTVTATDADANDQITYALGGVDQQHFVLNSSSGELAFSQLPASLDNPQDADGDNIYEVIITLSDLGANSSELNLSVNVVAFLGNIPEFASATASVDFDENAVAAVYTAQATDADGDTLTYSISGADSQHFTIDAASGVLGFNSAPDHEQPTDSGFDNVYNLSIAAEDPLGNQAQQSLTVSINDLNDNAPQFASSTAALDASENSTAITTITATDADSTADHATLTYSLNSGSDLNLFTLDPASGVLAFNSAPDYEQPHDSDLDNIYNVSIVASDGEHTASLGVSAVVEDSNDEAPQFTSASSLALDYTSVTLDATIYTATTSDADRNDLISYSLGTSSDAEHFSLSASGALAFVQQPSLDNPQDADADNEYQITIVATDLGDNNSSLELVVRVVDDLGNAPEFASASASLSVDENNASSIYLAQATDADGDTLTYSIAGADSNQFTIDPTSGDLAFNSAPDYEQPTDSGADNTYDLTITATDPMGNRAQQSLTVSVNNLNDNDPVFTLSSTTFAIPEGTTAITTIAATDLDGDTLTYTLTTTTDSPLFTLDSASGALSFISAPDHEAPQDADTDNTYDLTLSVSDGANATSQAISVAVTNVNEAPTFATASIDLDIDESSSSGVIYTFTASDLDGDSLSYSLTGADAQHFAIDAASGALSFQQAADFESPRDADGDSVYTFSVVAADSDYSASQEVNLSVADSNDEAPQITSGTSVAVDYSVIVLGATIYAATATDADANDQIAYSLSGVDAGHFSINISNGGLSFAQQPSLSEPVDADGDNQYQIAIVATDLAANSSSLELTVNVIDDIGSPPQFASASAAASFAENGVGIAYTATATDVDGDVLTYSIAGTDAAHFTINASSGVITFNIAPDYEAPLDSGFDNNYELIIGAQDPVGNQGQQSLTVAVSNVNDNAPAFAETAIATTVAENELAVASTSATDADGDDFVYALQTGADAALFAIDPSSGVIVFNSEPDYEDPQDSDGDNVYEFSVAASDGTYSGAQDFAVAIGDLNDEAPQFTSATSIAVEYDSVIVGFSSVILGAAVYTAQTADADAGDQVAYSLGGADAEHFNIDATSGALAFSASPSLESPQDADADNEYQVTIVATDLAANSSSLDLSVHVADDIGSPPAFAAPSASVAVNENSTSVVYTALADDPDAGDVISYGVEGADSALFAIDATSGELNFLSPPDYESPLDSGADNTYDLTITAQDLVGNQGQQSLTITITNLNDNSPQFTLSSTSFSVSENTTAVTTIAAADADGDDLTLALVDSGDSSLFSFDPASGALAFQQAPDHETPQDSDGDNVYELELSAFDGALSSSQSITVSVVDVNEAPSFAEATMTVAVDENNDSIVYTATASDPEQATLIYSASGADADLFTIGSSGALAFNTPPDYEQALDSGADNTYQLSIAASDGEYSTSQDLSIAVADVNEPPSFAAASVSLTTAENNLSFAYTVAAATDPDAGEQLSYQLSGDDQSAFSFDASTRRLAFVATPDYEAPADQNSNNAYQVAIVASDSEYSASHSIAIAVADLNDEAPQFTSATSEAINYSDVVLGAAVYSAQATDADADDQITYALGGADQQHFALDAASGALAFAQSPSLDDPQDADGDNSYELIITASDQANNSSELDLSIIVVDDIGSAPQFASDSMSVGFDENGVSTVYNALAIDADLGDSVAYSLSGTDANLFSIDSSSGALTFVNPPDYEQPADADANNVYELVITATDSPVGNQSQQSLRVTVNNVNDNLPAFQLSADSFTVSENTTAVTTVAAADADGDALTYALASSTDAAAFALDSSSGVLVFDPAPDFETPQDSNADNIYQLELSVFDGAYSTSLDLNVSVANIDEAPSFAAATLDLPVNENSSGAVYQAQASDPEQTSLTYSASGADASLFTLDSTSGDLAFNQSPNFETPLDQDADNVYQLDITATDGANPASQSLTVTVVDVNEPPTFASASVDTSTVENNANFAYSVAAASDEDIGEQLTYQLDGADSADFDLDAATRVLRFAANPDYEKPADADGDNVYQFSVVASDGEYQASQEFTISVGDINDEAPQFTSLSSQTVNYTTAQVGAVIYTASASDADANDQLSYALSGADASAFTLDSTSGDLAFAQLPSLTEFQSAGGDITYQLVVVATDLGANSSELDLSVSLLDDTGNIPEFAAASASVDFDENAVGVVYSAQATDADGDVLAYSISGVDAEHFTIDATSGALAFISPPDHEQPADSGGDNVYDLGIVVTDSPVGNQAQQSLAVTVNNLNDNAPQFELSASSFDVAENSRSVATVAASDADNDSLTFALVASADSSLFTIGSASGALVFNLSPDFESAQDSDGDNVYQLELSVYDNAYSTKTNISVVVTNVDEAPSFASASQDLAINENSSGAVYQAQANDPEGAPLAYSASGADASLFTLDPTSGELAFKQSPNFETPLDSDADNVYILDIAASDGANQASQSLSIVVADVNEAPSFTTTSVNLDTEENNLSFTHIVDAATDPDQDEQLTYALGGDDAAAFDFDAATRALAFKQSPDFETPLDQGADNVYQINIVASDSEYSASQAITIAVADLNDEAPQFTSASSLALDYTSVVVGAVVYTVQATDADAGDSVVYTLGGADSSSFAFDSSSGALAFVQAPSLETPQDADGDNVYQLSITATDLANNSSDLALSISIVDDTGSAPTFAQASASIAVDENSAGAIYTAQASDVDAGDSLTYSISGTDSSLFTIGSSSGDLAFISPPDHEQPADSDADNIYNLTITATDSMAKQAQQSLTISVNNLNDNPPQFALASSTFAIPENSTAITTITATDPDGDDLTFSLTTTTDSSYFTIDPTSGALSFNQAPDFETPQDSNADNTYELELSVADGANTTSQSITVTVTNVDEAPSFTSPTQNLSVNENNAAAIYQAQATDPEDASLAYSASGADAGLFTINNTSGDLAFKNPPSFESPLDQDGNNVYELSITATDGANQASQAVAVTVDDVNEAPTFASASVNLDTDENAASFAHIVEAADDEDQGDQLTYQLGGDDAAAFAFDANTRSLTFQQSPDYENPADDDANNYYRVRITAADAEYSTTQDITITVADLNDEAPQFTSATSLTLDYTAIVVGTNIYTAAATDADANDQVSFTLGGADASHFVFDSSSGALAFVQAPSLETPQDDNGDNTYELTITATDLGANSSELALSISVVDDTGSAPTFDQASVSIDVDENSPGTIYTAQASDVDPGDTLSYSISGVDAELLIIGDNGDIAFPEPPDYENPLDSGADNTYEITITATDSIGKQASQDLRITILNLNDNSPKFDLASTAFDVAENSTAITTVAADDVDGDDLTFALTNTSDASFFTLDPSSGVLSFNQAPDFETAQDSNSDNTYELELSVFDGAHTTTQAITVTVTDVDEAPSFTSASESVSVNENTSGAVYQAQATDPEGATLTYSASGADASLFTLDSTSGELAFKQSPNFEQALDQGADNTYNLDITASDGSHQVSQSLSITVADVNEAPAFASASVDLNAAENDSSFTHTVDAASDEDQNEQLTYQLSGDDAAAFDFDANTRSLTFQQSPDFENPEDQNTDNAYQITITASDGDLQATQAITVTVTDVDEAPSFASANESLSVNENTSGAVYQAQATDPEGATLTYSASGTDASLFTLDSTSGDLAFKQSPNFEQPTDQGANNTYELTITAADASNQTSQSLSITVTDVNEAPSFASASVDLNAAENDSSFAHIVDAAADEDSGQTLAYSLSGNDASDFNFDTATRSLSFKQAPDFENPEDQNTDNAYQITITASDSQYSTSQAITITVADLNDEAPQFTSAASLALDYTSVVVDTTIYTVQATDADAGDQITYTLSGTDASHFSFAASSGELAFSELPSLESPKDDNGDNSYELTITATDLGANSTDLALSVNVADDTGTAPTFASASASISVDENTASAVYTAQASDVDPGDILTYSISGTDHQLFTIDPSSGELAFNTAPDYENPSDSGTDNIYDLAITATDTIGKQANQSLTISVNNLNDNAPKFALASTAFDVAENSTAITTVAANDSDGDSFSFALVSTADSSLFTLDPTSGVLSFNQAPDFETPADDNSDNTYELKLSVDDGANTTTQEITITVTNIDEAPTFTSASESVSVNENTSGAVYQAQATDPEDATLTYSASGTDASLFTLDPTSGELAFKNSPDYESPADDGADNTYNLDITAADATNQVSQALTITIADVNEAPAFASTSVDLNAAENDSSFAHIVEAASDEDSGQTLAYSLSGDDASEFNFDTATRTLAFKQAPDFESPADQNTDNAYQITITASDGDLQATQAITITVTNVEEYPYFHSTADYVDSIAEDPATEGTASPVLALAIQAADDEDDSAGKSLNFVISGGADSDKFSLTSAGANSANLSFAISPDFDNPHDSNLDNNYSLTIQVEDSNGDTAQHDLIVAVQAVNDEAPQLTSASSADVNENDTAVFYFATAEDADRSDWSDPDSSKHYQLNLDTLTFSLDSANYPDSSFFAIDASSGELQAASGLDYESPQSSAQSNNYTVGIKVADQANNSSTSPITITVTDDPDESDPVASSGPQIPWFYSDVAVGESIDIPWVIYSGDGAIAWSMLVNGTTVCSESASISDPDTSGVCSVSSSYLGSGSNLNAAAVSVTYSDSSSELSDEVTFAYAASSAISFPSPSSSQDATACASVDVGDVVNATNNSACYDYLLGDDDFGGPHDQVPSYLDPANGRDFEVIAYFIEWGIYSRDFQPADLPANLLSTALFSFVKLKGDDSADPNCESCSFTGEVDLADGWAALSKSYATDTWCDINYDDWTVDSACKANGIFKQFWLLKQKFPHLKTCVSVGGWSFSRPFPLVAENATMRATFADSIVDMAEKYHFDCIDIDWEFPIIGGGDYKVTDASGNPSYDYDLDGNTPFLAPSDNDAQYFADLIQELRAEIDSRGLAIDINSAMYSGDYGMSKMDYNLFAGNLHGIHMMTYDFYGAWDPYTGMQAALFPNSDPLSNEVALQYPDAYNNQHNIASAMARAVNNAIDNGFESNTAMRRKIVPGLAFYGRNYSGVSTNPVPGAYMVLANSPAEQLSWEQGNLNYVQLKGYYDHGETLHGNGDYDGGGYNTGGRSWTYNWDEESQTPFLYDSGTQSFISYTDPRGIFYQTCHAARENSKGVMFWEISGDSDDSQLVQAIHAALRGDTLSQYTDQPHCDDIIGYGAASSTSSDDDDDGGSGNDDGGGNDDDGGDTGGGDTGGDTSSGTSGLQELEDLGYFTETVFNSLFYNTTLNQGSSTDGACTGYSFFNNWLDLKEAATYYPDFAAEGSMEDRLRELAAFLANTSHETTGAWQTYALDPALGARYHYGYCFKEEVGCENQTSCTQYCDSANTEYGYACSLGTTYHGRGPIQFTWNYNYGAMSEVLYGNNNYTLLENPSILVTDAVISYRSALWFWMTVQAPKPSAHDVMIGNYSAEASKNRYPGFGMTINIINGGLECGTDDFAEAKNKNRLGFYLAYLKVLGDAYGREISPWVTESSTSITYGSTPATYSAFDLNEADLISRYTDVETYLSCKNMEHY